MLRHVAIAAAALAFGLAATCVFAAGEMSMPGASIGSSASAESETSVREEVSAVNAMHGAAPSSSEVVHPRLHPDSVSEARAESRAPGAGSDVGAGETTGGKRHHGGPWQSLLPGVMK